MIAIHQNHRGFSRRWIQYCEENRLEFIRLDIFDSDLVQKVRENNIRYFLFHFGTGNYETDLYLKKIVYSLEREGVNVFPSYSLYWHYDDKLTQKHLFESLGAPHAPMKVFFRKHEALNWVNDADFPFVFKLRGGAGSKNVKLVNNKREARKLVGRMFGKGIYPVRPVFSDLKTTVRKHNKKKDWKKVLARSPRTYLNSLKANRYLAPEKGYFLVQQFYPDNQFDTRITVVGKKAVGFRRYNRPQDFRASGSGLIDFNPDKVDRRCLQIAFDIAEKIDDSSLAFDFIYDRTNQPKIIEISYCYVSDVIFKAGGYWNRDLNYFNDPIIPEYEIINNMLDNASEQMRETSHQAASQSI